MFEPSKLIGNRRKAGCQQACMREGIIFPSHFFFTAFILHEILNYIL